MIRTSPAIEILPEGRDVMQTIISLKSMIASVLINLQLASPYFLQRNFAGIVGYIGVVLCNPLASSAFISCKGESMASWLALQCFWRYAPGSDPTSGGVSHSIHMITSSGGSQPATPGC
jgi:hypothetical protein